MLARFRRIRTIASLAKPVPKKMTLVSRLLTAPSFALLFLLQGCVAVSQDISTGGATATVESFKPSTSTRSKCSLHPERRYGGRFHTDTILPKGARSLRVDAGRVSFLAYCTFPDSKHNGGGLVFFDFESESGHRYTLNLKDQEDACLELVDVTDKAEVISCEPFRPSIYINLSTDMERALVTTGGLYSRNLARCRFRVRNTTVGSIHFDPGENTLHVQCFLEGELLGNRYGKVLLTFPAKAGHVYTVDWGDDQSICLIDVTSDWDELVCEKHEPIFRLTL